jgi:hypothetical protein
LEEKDLKEQIKDKLQKKLENKISNLTIETVAEFKDEQERLESELSDDERDLPIMDETVRELHETSLEHHETGAPYGYFLKKNKLQVNEEEAKKVKLIFSWFYKHKKSLEEISERVQLTITRIKNILINPIYFGRILLNGEIRKGKHPAIIDKHFCKICNINADDIVQIYLSSSLR